MTDPAVEFPHDDLGADEYAPRYYRRDGTPVDLSAEQFEILWREHGVATTTIANPDGTRSTISTVFLGVDHNLAAGPNDPPILFETAVFDGTGLVFRSRSRTEAAARDAHASALIDLVAAIGRSSVTDPFPTAPTRYVADPDAELHPEPAAPDEPAPADS